MAERDCIQGAKEFPTATVLFPTTTGRMSQSGEVIAEDENMIVLRSSFDTHIFQKANLIKITRERGS